MSLTRLHPEKLRLKWCVYVWVCVRFSILWSVSDACSVWMTTAVDSISRVRCASCLPLSTNSSVGAATCSLQSTRLCSRIYPPSSATSWLSMILWNSRTSSKFYISFYRLTSLPPGGLFLNGGTSVSVRNQGDILFQLIKCYLFSVSVSYVLL